MVTLDADIEFQYPYSEVCNRCRHLDDSGKRVCEAFPDGIPDLIWTGKNKHTGAYHGDHGIHFEPMPGR